MSNNEILEAMVFEESYLRSISEWKATRRKNDRYVVLRNGSGELNDLTDAASDVELLARFVKVASYWLSEKYALLDALRGKPSPSGRSICSTLATKVLNETGHVEPKIAWSGQLYPGDLLENLVQRGWNAWTPSPDYFDGRFDSGYRAVRMRSLTTGTKSQMHSFWDFANFVSEKLIDDLLSSNIDDPSQLCQLINSSQPEGLLPFLRLQTNDVLNGAYRLDQLLAWGAEHWSAEHKHEDAVASLRRKSQKQSEFLLLAATQAHMALKAASEQLASVEELGLIKAKVSAGEQIDSSVLVDLSQRYANLEVTFASILGTGSREYKEPVFEANLDQYPSLGEGTEYLHLAYLEALKPNFDGLVEYAEATAKLISLMRSILKMVLSDEFYRRMDTIVSSALGELTASKGIVG